MILFALKNPVSMIGENFTLSMLRTWYLIFEEVLINENNNTIAVIWFCLSSLLGIKSVKLTALYYAQGTPWICTALLVETGMMNITIFMTA